MEVADIRIVQGLKLPFRYTVGVPAVKFNYGYDAVGNLITVNDRIDGTNAATTGYTYDLLNRVTKLTQAGTGVQTKRVDKVIPDLYLLPPP